MHLMLKTILKNYSRIEKFSWGKETNNYSSNSEIVLDEKHKWIISEGYGKTTGCRNWQCQNCDLNIFYGKFDRVKKNALWIADDHGDCNRRIMEKVCS